MKHNSDNFKKGRDFMFHLSKDWNPINSRLRDIIKKTNCLDEAISLTLKLHSIVHFSSVSGTTYPTYTDEIFAGVEHDKYCIMPTVKDVTLAWNIWHITRIEDIVANLLIAEEDQVFNDVWKAKLNTSITDTGNALSDEEIINHSKELSIPQLFEYRNAVGSKTRSIIEHLSSQAMKRKVNKEQLDKIFFQGGVTDQDDSVWLLDFWGKKDIAGLILMPITRHQIVHLNDCYKLRKKIYNTV